MNHKTMACVFSEVLKSGNVLLAVTDATSCMQEAAEGP
jgi:hypothetical protein